MQFAKKLPGGSHSRSSSVSSNVQNLVSSPTSNTSKQSCTSNTHSSKKSKEKIPQAIEKPILSHSQSSSLGLFNGNHNIYSNNGTTIYEESDFRKTITASNSSDSCIMQTTSSNEHLQSTSISKDGYTEFNDVILPWDTTDPTNWTTARILSWLRFYEFPDVWIAFFERHQINGNRFIRLLAYENFAIYEKYLPDLKNGSYNRFQHLLKETMTKNVTYNYEKNKISDKKKPSRSTSESNRTPQAQEDVHTTRSTSDSIISDVKLNTSGIKNKETIHSTNRHKKTKSASSLYRRSFISLRSATNFNQPPAKPNSNINLKIPVQLSTNTNPKVNDTQSATTPPISPSIFRRHHKSNSSDSSLFNFLFGSSNGSVAGTPTSKPANVKPSTPKLQSHFKSISEQGASQQKLPQNSSKSFSPNVEQKLRNKSLVKENQKPAELDEEELLPIHSTKSIDETLTRPAKIKVPLNNLSVDNIIENSPESIHAHTSNDQLSNKKISETSKSKDIPVNNKFLIDDKYLPFPKTPANLCSYILITKDNTSFYPISTKGLTSIDSFRDTVFNLFNLKTKHITIHLTDYNHDPGYNLPDEVLEQLIENIHIQKNIKLLIKDHSKIPLRSRAATVSSEANVSLRSVKSKNSVHSINSNNINSIDQITVTSSSDTNSFDELGPSYSRRYPQTPSHYYDYNTNEETNYWNIKDSQEDSSLSKLKSKQSFPNLYAEKKLSYFSTPESRNSEFNSKDDLMDSENRKLSQIELAPKRDAPKAPGGLSPQRRHSLSKRSSLKIKRGSVQPPRSKCTNRSPSIHSGSSEVISQTTESVVSAYTPASTQVFTPQPYKGASDSTRKIKSEDDIANSNSAKQLQSNRKNSMSSVLTARPGIGSRTNSKRIVSSSSAADVFEENVINFSDAPNLTDSDSGSSLDEIIWFNKDVDSNNKNKPEDEENYSDSSDDIIWSTNSNSNKDSSKYHDAKNYFEGDMDSKLSKEDNEDNMVLKNEISDEVEGLTRKMTLRPSPEEVYRNLERFFPDANLDKPILEGVTPPASPNPGIANQSRVSTNRNTALSPLSPHHIKTENGTKQPSINSLKRTKTIRTIAHEASKARKNSRKLTRQNTKMWGTRIFEVTDKQGFPINKAKNSKGEYTEFAWIKGEMIGKGSFGAVYLSLNITTGEMIAVKQIEVPKYSSQNEAIVDTVEAMRLEVSTLKDLDHLNIVQYLGFEKKNNIYSLFLEYVAGGSVGSLIRMYGRFDDKLIRHLTKQVLEGLSYLHSRGILHRDMKADNLLLDQDGICKISDFGISKKSEDIYSNSEMTMRGTVFWMAPEMVDTKQGYSAKVDIWSLGCVVLEMFAGKRPWSNFEVVTAMFKIGQSKSAPPIPEDTRDLVSDIAKNFLDLCFSIDPDTRPTADKLLSHPFCSNDEYFEFSKTELAKFIKSNDKINSTKLRITSEERNK